MCAPVKWIYQGPATHTLLLICKQQLFAMLYQLRHTLLSLHGPLLLFRTVLHGGYQCCDVLCHRVPKHYIYEAKKKKDLEPGRISEVYEKIVYRLKDLV